MPYENWSKAFEDFSSFAAEGGNSLYGSNETLRQFGQVMKVLTDPHRNMFADFETDSKPKNKRMEKTKEAIEKELLESIKRYENYMGAEKWGDNIGDVRRVKTAFMKKRHYFGGMNKEHKGLKRYKRFKGLAKQFESFLDEKISVLENRKSKRKFFFIQEQQ